MARVTAEQYADKHARNLRSATEFIRAGVNSVTVSPMAKAAQSVEKMRQGINRALDDGTWQRGLNRVTLEDWKAQMINVGIGRIGSGIDAARPKVISFAQELLPHIDRGVATVNSMPNITLEDNINRMTTFIRHMAGFRRQR
jgi:hypothetical protein